jgi:molybdate transport system substrate-binding protein
MKKLFLILLFSICYILRFSLSPAAEAKPEIIVAAAANLSEVLNDIKPLFEKTYSCKLTITFGSTGLLSHQIEEGAPYDVFAAADVTTIDALEKKGLIVPGTKAIYARGRIVYWQRKDAKIICTQLKDLTQPGIRRVAIANPETAPYGQAAKETLMSEKLWDSVKDKLVYGENIRQTKQYAETGNVDGAILAMSLTKDTIGQYFVIDSSLHKPIDQAMGVIKRSTHQDLAKKYCDFLLSPTCKPIWEKYGYESPRGK